MRVIVVDDLLVTRAGIVRLLTDAGVEVVAEAEDAVTLFDLVGRLVPDAVVLDIRMPGMDGLEFLHALRQMDASVPVIVLTAYGAVESYLKSLSLGVFEYINKPIKAKELGRIVQAAIDSSERSDPPVDISANNPAT